ncbi:MAG: YsnF/AvaK domain-containing protein [Leptolyngbyaceae cyanobacterium bins.349]|nr:YsnF/AvaK domain-containing protein [Leptolyngbyaceae cyanobacterium bins.349]
MSDDKTKNPLFDPNDSNPDPITGEPGAHPVGTGIGAAGAGTVGAVVGGAVGGPVGAVIGSVIGAVAGGLAGKGAAEKINPTVEEEYWRNNYSSRPYVDKKEKFEDYHPAYKTGYEGYNRYGATGKTYDEVEPDLRRDYETNHGGTGMAWEKAKHAAKDAWNRVENALPGDDATVASTGDRTVANTDAETVRLYEERLIADKHRDKVGDVVVGKHTETETAHVTVPIEKERVVIERVNPVDAGRTVTTGEANFGDSEVARIEVYEEAADIRKEAFVAEEVRVKKIVDRETVEANEQLRREELDVDTSGQPIIDNR